jgi:hypothetical protein
METDKSDEQNIKHINVRQWTGPHFRTLTT